MRDILELEANDNAAMRFMTLSGENETLNEFREGLRLLSSSYPARALIHFMRAAEKEKENPYFMSYLGLTLAIAHTRWTEGAELCEKALRLKRNQAQLHLNLAQVHLSAGNREEAYAVLEAGLRFTARDPRIVRAMNRLGNRRQPIFPFLNRKNPINRYAGRVRHITKKLLRAR